MGSAFTSAVNLLIDGQVRLEIVNSQDSTFSEYQALPFWKDISIQVEHFCFASSRPSHHITSRHVCQNKISRDLFLAPVSISGTGWCNKKVAQFFWKLPKRLPLQCLFKARSDRLHKMQWNKVPLFPCIKCTKLKKIRSTAVHECQLCKYQRGFKSNGFQSSLQSHQK